MRSIHDPMLVLSCSAMVLYVLQTCVRCWQKLLRMRCSSKMTWQISDPMRAKVYELMSKRRLQRAKQGRIIFSHMLAVYIFFNIARLLKLTRQRHGTEYDFIVGLVCLWFTLLAGQFPAIIRPWTIDVFFTAYLAVKVVEVLLAPSIMKQRSLYVGVVGGQRLALLTVLGHAKVSVVTNVVYTICAFGILTYSNGWSSSYVTWEFGFLLVILIMTWMIHTWMYSEARATLEMRHLARSEASVHRVLSAMCDAVLHLGPKGIIRYPAPKLEALLLKSRTRASLQHTLFTDLLDGNEKERFSNFLSLQANDLPQHEPPDQEQIGCLFHSYLTDATNTKVPVQIFYGSYLDISEQVCHVLGIREDGGDITRFEQDVNHSHGSNLAPLMEHRPMPMTDDNSDRSSVSASEAAGEVAAWVDISTPTYQVVQSTASFSALCGSSNSPIELLQWISDREHSVFKAWVQEAFNLLIHGCEARSDQLQQEIEMMPPHMQRFQLHVMAVVDIAEVKICTLDDCDDSEPRPIMQFTFSDLSWIHRKRCSRRGQKRRQKRAATVSI